MRQAICLLVVCCFSTQVHADDIISPLPVRNFDPAMMRFFDPTPDSALRSFDQSWSFELNHHYTTLNLYDRLPNAQLLIDMELYVFDPVIRRSFSDSFEVSLRTPYLLPSSGIFDAAIQTFHGWFNMPNGGRQHRPNNSYTYALNHQDGAQWQAENRWELGNIELSARYLVAGDNTRALAMLAAMKLPTASKSRGWGSSAYDIGVGFVASRSQDNWFGHVEGWIIQPLANDESGIHYTRYARGSLSAGYQVFDAVAVIVQAQGGQSPYQSGIHELDQSPFLISFGLRGITKMDWGWNIAVVENISQKTTQDISITAGIHWQVK